MRTAKIGMCVIGLIYATGKHIAPVLPAMLKLLFTLIGDLLADYAGAIRWLGTPYRITSIMLQSANHEQAARFMQPVEELIRGPAINSLSSYITLIRRKSNSLTVSWRRFPL